MLREDKERVVAELVERLSTAETLLVADYRGLTHAELDGVRTELLKRGARFAVVKNTLTKRAADAAGVDGAARVPDRPDRDRVRHEGDTVAVAKTLGRDRRQTRRLELEGRAAAGKAITPTRSRARDAAPADVLRGQLLGAIVGPMAAIVGIFGAPLRDLVGVIDARIRQLEGAADRPMCPRSVTPSAPKPSRETGGRGGAEASETAAARDEPRTRERAQPTESRGPTELTEDARRRRRGMAATDTDKLSSSSGA